MSNKKKKSSLGNRLKIALFPSLKKKKKKKRGRPKIRRR